MTTPTVPVGGDASEPSGSGHNGNGKSATLWNYTNLGAVGLICWMFYNGLTTTLPKMQNDFNLTIQRTQDQFREELKVQREHDDRRAEHLMKAHERQADQVVKAVSDLAAEIRRSNGHSGK